MNLPIEFTTTVKRKQLTAFHRNTSFKRGLWLLLLIIPAAYLLLLVLFGSEQLSTAESTRPFMPFILALAIIEILLWLVLRYFLNSYFVNKQLKKNPSTTAVRAYVLNLDTVSHFSELDNGEFSWELVSAATVSDQLISLSMKSGSAHLIDPTDLEAEQLMDLKALLLEKGF